MAKSTNRDHINTDNYNEITRKIGITYKVRHKAASRLEHHKLYSIWVLSLIAFALIILEIESQSSIVFYLKDETVNILQIIIAVMVLVYSLILSINDYSTKAIKMYFCALSLGKLRDESFTMKPNNSNIKHLTAKYHAILNKCQNHAYSDYLVYLKEKNKKMKKVCFYYLVKSHYIKLSITLITL